MIEAGKIKPVIDRVYPLEQIKIYVLRVEAGREAEAFALLRKKMQDNE
jgi:NADPH:quinone reductase-like Zn-dependent oxidoreductase